MGRKCWLGRRDDGCAGSLQGRGSVEWTHEVSCGSQLNPARIKRETGEGKNRKSFPAPVPPGWESRTEAGLGKKGMTRPWRVFRILGLPPSCHQPA
jgi:hypothetical protein